MLLGVAIGQLISLSLPSCCPRFESKAHHLCFYEFIIESFHVQKTKINKKSAEFSAFLKTIASQLSMIFFRNNLNYYDDDNDDDDNE